MSDELLLGQARQEEKITQLPEAIKPLPSDIESSPAPLPPLPSFSPRKWALILLSAILLLSGLNIGISRLQNVSRTSRRVETRILPVTTTRIETVKSYAATQTYTGEVAAARASELGFERAGKIVWLNVDRGKQVTAATPIAKLDTQNLEAQRQQMLAQKAQAVAVLQELQNGPRTEAIATARSQVRDLENQFGLERIRRSRREYLYKQGAVSREQLDEVAFNQNALSDRMAAAQSRLDELETGTRPEQIAAQQAVVRQLEASIVDLEITITKSTIAAPFSGTISQRNFDEGTVVNAGQSVMRLVERVSPEVEIGVPVDIATRLEPGSQQQVKIGQKTYQARLASILPEVNASTGTRTVVLLLDASALQLVAPNQIARLEVTQTVATEGYWLPTTALVRGERGLWSCYALAETKTSSDSKQEKPYRVERRDVEVLRTEGDRVLVRGTLQSGDTVIVNGTHRIVPGQLVRAVD